MDNQLQSPTEEQNQAPETAESYLWHTPNFSDTTLSEKDKSVNSTSFLPYFKGQEGLAKLSKKAPTLTPGTEKDTLSTSYLSAALNKDSEDVAQHLSYYQSSYAKAMGFGDDVEGDKFFDAMGKFSQKYEDHSNLVAGIYNDIYTGYLTSNKEGSRQAYQTNREKYKTMPGYDPKHDDFLQATADSAINYIDNRGHSLTSSVDTLSKYLEAVRAKNSKGASVVGETLGGLPIQERSDLESYEDQAVQALTNLSPEDREIATALASQNAGNITLKKRPFILAAGEELNRGIGQFATGLISSFSDALPEQSQKNFDVQRRLDQLVNGTIDPIEGGNVVSKFMLSTTNQLPVIIASYTGAGLGVLAASNYGNIKTELKDQGITGAESVGIAATTSLIQTGSQYYIGKLFRNLAPSAESSFANLSKIGTSQIAKALAKETVIRGAEFGGITAGQLVAKPFSQQVMAMIDHALPEELRTNLKAPNWQEEFTKPLVEAGPNTAMGLGAYMILGLGMGKFHSAYAKTLMTDELSMKAVGIPDEKIVEIREAPNTEAKQQIFQQAFQEEKKFDEGQKTAVHELNQRTQPVAPLKNAIVRISDGRSFRGAMHDDAYSSMDFHIGDLVGEKVKYLEWEGILYRDNEGNFTIAPSDGGKPVQVEGSGKTPATPAKEIGVVPTDFSERQKIIFQGKGYRIREGFEDEEGTFYNREDAMKHARKYGLLNGPWAGEDLLHSHMIAEPLGQPDGIKTVKTGEDSYSVQTSSGVPIANTSTPEMAKHIEEKIKVKDQENITKQIGNAVEQSSMPKEAARPMTLSERAIKAQERLAKNIKTRGFAGGFDKESIEDAAIVTADLIHSGAIKAADASAKILEMFGEAAAPYADEIEKLAQGYAASEGKQMLQAATAQAKQSPEVNRFTGLWNTLRENVSDVAEFRHETSNAALPKMSAISSEITDAAVDHANSPTSRQILPLAAHYAVLGEKYNDAEFNERLGTFGAEDMQRGLKQHYLDEATKLDEKITNATDAEEKRNLKREQKGLVEDASKVTTFMSDEDYERESKDPEILLAVAKHKESVQKPAEEMHTSTGGKLGISGLKTGIYLNMKAVFGEDTDKVLLSGGSKAGNVTGSMKRGSVFSKERTGTGKEYLTDYKTLTQRMLSGNYESYTRNKLYDAVIKNGAGVISKTSPGEGYTALPVQGYPKGETLWVKDSVYPELRRVLNLDPKLQISGLSALAAKINKATLVSGVEGVYHTANLIRNVAQTVQGRGLLSDLAIKNPFVSIPLAISKIYNKTRQLMDKDPELYDSIYQVSKSFGIRGNPFVDEQLNRLNPNKWETSKTGKLINTLDLAGRLVINDMFEDALKQGMILEDTPANRLEWLKKSGNYNERLQSNLQRMVKQTGISPFVTAGINKLQNGIDQMLLLSPRMKGLSDAGRRRMVASKVANAAFWYVSAPLLLNLMLWKDAFPNGVPAGAIKIGVDKQSKPIYIDPLQWTGMRTGMRATGVEAMIDGMRKGDSFSTTSTHIARDMAGEIIRPFTGVPADVASLALTGHTTYSLLNGRAPETGRPGTSFGNLLYGFTGVNPLASSAGKGFMEEPTAASLASKVGSGVLKAGEDIASAVTGVKKGPADTPITRTFQKAELFKEQLGIAKTEEQFAPSEFGNLKKYISEKDDSRAISEIRSLVAKERGANNEVKYAKIEQAVKRSYLKNFIGSRVDEAQFVKSLSPKEKVDYDKAMQIKMNDYVKAISLIERAKLRNVNTSLK